MKISEILQKDPEGREMGVEGGGWGGEELKVEEVGG